MTTEKIIVWCCGIHSLAFAAFHSMFWKVFKWKEELQKLSVANRAIMQIANLRLIYVFLLVSFLCFFLTDDLLQTRLGHAFLAGMAVFWSGRTVEQFIYLRLNSAMVHALTLLFIIGAILFALPLLI